MEVTASIPYIRFFIVLMFLGDIKLPNRVQEAMQMQVEAERKKRAAVLESEGKKTARSCRFM